MKRILTAIFLSFAGLLALQAQSQSPLQLSKTIALPGVTGRFDHFAFDSSDNRLFVAATGNHSVEVVDITTGRVAESIKGLGKPHGLAWIPETKRLFVADGSLAALQVYEGTPFRLIKTIKLSDDADDLTYDEGSRLLYVGHGGSSATVPGQVAVIDTRELALIKNLPASSHPEALDIDQNGHRVFVNLADDSQVAVIDTATNEVSQKWPVSKARENVPMAYIKAEKLLLLGCRAPGNLILMDATTGKELDSLPASTGADDLFYEPDSHRAYLITGSGHVDVYQIDAATKVHAVGTVATGAGAKTGFLIPTRHLLYIAVPSTAEQPAKLQVYSTVLQ